MARPLRIDLDFFPFDVDFFNDEKLDDVQNEYGPLGEAIYLRLLCLIYSNKGYYYKFESIDRVASKIIRSIGNRWVRDKEYVKKIISYLAECNLFSKELMRDNILTSVGIQRRYVYVMEKIHKRKVHITKYNLIEKADKEVGFEFVPENEVNSEETHVNSEETPCLLGNNATNKSKIKENKINEIKIDESKSAVGGLQKNLHSRLFDDYSDSELRQELVEIYGEDRVKEYEVRFDDWARSKKRVNIGKYQAILNWLYEDFH